MQKISFCSSFVLLPLLSLCFSCGNETGKSSKPTDQLHTETQKQSDQGKYRAILSPLNKSLSQETIGKVEIKIEADEVLMETNVAGTHAGVKHFQHIMTGGECPTMVNDLNQDLVLDVKEAETVTGKIFIPIDADLSEQLAGMDFGPISNSTGSFVYRRSTTLSHLLSDLRMPDPDVLDSVVKLLPEDDLNLAGKLILIYGVAPETNLPLTVANLPLQPIHLSVPIACGVLTRVTAE